MHRPNLHILTSGCRLHLLCTSKVARVAAERVPREREPSLSLTAKGRYASRSSTLPKAHGKKTPQISKKTTHCGICSQDGGSPDTANIGRSLKNDANGVQNETVSGLSRCFRSFQRKQQAGTDSLRRCFEVCQFHAGFYLSLCIYQQKARSKHFLHSWRADGFKEDDLGSRSTSICQATGSGGQ